MRPFSKTAHRRRAISLLEVLMAIFIITIGILGVASLLPLATHLANKGTTMDRAAIGGRAANSTFVTREYNNADLWFTAAGAKVSMTPNDAASPLNAQGAKAFCIDPRLVTRDATAATFPAHGTGPTMPRLNLWDGQYAAGSEARTSVMSQSMADHVFNFSDDLLYLNDDPDQPAQQVMIGNQRGAELRFSWFATLTREQTSSAYILSTIICSGRFKPAKADESALTANILVGIGGAEVTVTGAKASEVRNGNWLLLSNGPRFRWYQVISTANESASPRELSLRGPDWDTSGGFGTATATFIPSIVAVYERTIRVDGQRTLWSN